MFRSPMIWTLALLCGLAVGPASSADTPTTPQKTVPPNWPTNPYWTKTPAPNGPGHKAGSFAELLEKAGGDKSRIGIKVGYKMVDWKTGDLGVYRVGDELKLGACIGLKDDRIAFNHKGGHGGGLNKATLLWMDGDGKTELARKQLDGGCG